jgi:sucrose-6-phosphate hydrolase SacC (GH32 family)
LGTLTVTKSTTVTEILFDFLREFIHVFPLLHRTRSGKTDWSPDFPARVSAPLKHAQAKSIPIEIVVDNNSIEVFAEDGETVLTNLIYPAPASQGLAFYATNTPTGAAPARVRNVELVPLVQTSVAK